MKYSRGYEYMVKVLKTIVCLFLGHRRLNEIKNDKHSPFGIGAGDFSYYPMWPCDRCGVMYIEHNKQETDKVWVGGDEIHRSNS